MKCSGLVPSHSFLILDALMVPSLLLNPSVWTIILVSACRRDLLLLVASHEVMENAEVAPFDIAYIVE